ncbi:hypothetical protein B0H10DRAFT_2433181 [Mycena sp. CBHHK59/15]|nr:hypothetical protein B0H10DRAFT_2433181 [Mycena sp. CBHHK59/15]
MAHYLPVLLVSVATNAFPDDSALSTLPRGQVDYLSHDWQEEDVWRSWRNMTRQKNEIANGMRLENASWRTWWKQRNKLKTVTPETLNWLKDSDVTWLYGPLHTAVDWTPPPKPKPDPTEVGKQSSPTISDLPLSPIFSPAESEDEEDDDAVPPPSPPLHCRRDAPRGPAPALSSGWDGRTRGIRWAGAPEDDDSDSDDAWTPENESALSSDSDDAIEMLLSSTSAARRTSSSASKTIAPIAPTILKTTGVGNGWAGDRGIPGDALVYVPSVGSAARRESPPVPVEEADFVYTHRSAYFSAGDDAYDYFGGPDLGEDFTRRRARRRGDDAEILEIEKGSRSRSRSRSQSRSRTPSPAVLAGTSPPSAASPPPVRSGLLSPPPRGRDSRDSSSSSQGRGRSATRTSSSSSLSDRERSRSSHTSPLGSLSPDGIAAYGTYARFKGPGTTSSTSPEESPPPPPVAVPPPVSVSVSLVSMSLVSSASVPDDTSTSTSTSTSSNSNSNSSQTATVAPPSPSTPPIPISPPRAKKGGGLEVQVGQVEAEVQVQVEAARRANPTPANSPVVHMRPPPAYVLNSSNTSTSKPTPPILISPRGGGEEGEEDARRANPTPANSPVVRTRLPPPPPRTAASATTSGAGLGGSTGTSASALQRTLALPPGDADGTIVGKAVGMMSTAGAYLGLWSGAVS